MYKTTAHPLELAHTMLSSRCEPEIELSGDQDLPEITERLVRPTKVSSRSHFLQL